MPTIQELIAKYFSVKLSDETPDYRYTKGSKVEPLVDGDAYFASIMAEMGTLTAATNDDQRYFYALNWKIQNIDMGGSSLENRLINMHDSGVDVRILPWFSMLLFKADWRIPDFKNLPLQTTINGNLRFVHAIRKAAFDRARNGLKPKGPIPKPKSKEAKRGANLYLRCVLNTLAHPMGSAHMKVVVCGDKDRAVAFVSGLDLAFNRAGTPGHPDGGWHDVGVRIEGPAAAEVYAVVREYWNEQIARKPTLVYHPDSSFFGIEKGAAKKSKDPTHHDVLREVYVADPDVKPYLISPPIALRAAPASSSPGTCHVQVLRTVPQFNIGPPSVGDGLIDWWVTKTSRAVSKPLSFAPGGAFEYRDALLNAIGAAEKYIYIEDQGLTSWEAMRWIRDRLQAKPDLKVIFVNGSDPADPGALYDLRFHAVNDGLLDGLADPEDRIAFYLSPSIDSAGGSSSPVTRRQLAVHSKVVIVDDEWAAVGSANFMRRGLYTDEELSVGVLDEGSPTFAAKLRMALWADHCGLGASQHARVADLTKAMGIWRSGWGVTTESIRDGWRSLALPLSFPTAKALGTVGLKPGSVSVLGRGGASWLGQSLAGKWLVVGPDSDPDFPPVYKIEKVVSDTELEISPPFGGTSAVQQQYTIAEPGQLFTRAEPYDEATADRYDFDSRNMLTEI